MCGIVGQVNFDGSPVCPVLLKKMTDVISHRGPDGEGHWIEDNIGLGHRRLSIIDLSPAGNQPMVSNDQRFVLSYNGEIYNFKELRQELKEKSYSFVPILTQSCYERTRRMGIGCLLKFNGMFALAFGIGKKRDC